MILLVPAGILWVALALARRLAQRPLPPTSPIAAERDERVRRQVARAAVLIAVMGNVPLLGIPGAAFLDVATRFAPAACSERELGRFGADAGWPTAMFLTVLWPAVMPLVYCAIRTARTRLQLFVLTGAGAFLAVATGVAMALFFIVRYC